MKPSEILKQKREEVLKIAAKYGVKNIRVFGSIARGEDDEKSDVDLLINVPDGFTLLDHAGLMLDLEELLGYKVDIASERGLKKRTEQMILCEAVPI